MPPDESIFLTEIAAAPRSVDRRLIYADWLEEHGDPRGELIQLWHEQDSLKPWTAEYAERSFRIRKIQAATDAGWLSQLGYSATCRPMLAEIPRDRPSRWRLLTAFLEAWHRTIQNTDRVSESIVRTRESVVGQRLPAALVEWYAHSGYADDIWRPRAADSLPYAEELVQPTELMPYPERDQLEIGRMSGGLTGYFLKLSELGMDDPPVYYRDRDNYLSVELSPTGQALSEFAICRAVVVTIYASARTPGWAADLANPLRYVPSHFHETGMAEVPSIEGPYTIVEGADVLVMIHESGLTMTTRSVDAGQQILDNIPVARHRIDGRWQDAQDERRFVPGVSDADLLEG